MVKFQVSKAERRNWKKLLKTHYPGGYVKAIVSKAAETHITLSESDVMSFYNRGIVKWAAVILQASAALIEEAKAKQVERAEKLTELSAPQKSATL